MCLWCEGSGGGGVGGWERQGCSGYCTTTFIANSASGTCRMFVPPVASAVNEGETGTVSLKLISVPRPGFPLVVEVRSDVLRGLHLQLEAPARAALRNQSCVNQCIGVHPSPLVLTTCHASLPLATGRCTTRIPWTRCTGRTSCASGVIGTQWAPSSGSCTPSPWTPRPP